MVPTVVVTAAAGPLGRRVCERVAADPAVGRVVAVDRPGRALAPTLTPAAAIEAHLLELDDPALAGLCAGASAVVHLATTGPRPSGGERTGGDRGRRPPRSARWRV